MVRRYEFKLPGPAAVFTGKIEDAMEHHCVLFKGQTPVSVVGTTSKFSYFEGTFQPPYTPLRGQALMSWYETRSTRIGLIPSMGGAWLSYEFNGSTVKLDGSSYSIVPSTHGSYQRWYASGGLIRESSDAFDAAAIASMKANFKRYCLLVKGEGSTWSSVLGSAAEASDPMHKPPSLQLPSLDRTTWRLAATSAGNSVQGKKRLCIKGYTISGQYEYVYSQDSIRKDLTIRAGSRHVGHFQTDTIHFSSSLGEGLVGAWVGNQTSEILPDASGQLPETAQHCGLLMPPLSMPCLLTIWITEALNCHHQDPACFAWPLLQLMQKARFCWAGTATWTPRLFGRNASLRSWFSTPLLSCASRSLLWAPGECPDIFRFALFRCPWFTCVHAADSAICG